MCVHLSFSTEGQHLSMFADISAPSINCLLKIQQQSHWVRIYETHEDKKEEGCTLISGQSLSKFK